MRRDLDRPPLTWAYRVNAASKPLHRGPQKRNEMVWQELHNVRAMPEGTAPRKLEETRPRVRSDTPSTSDLPSRGRPFGARPFPARGIRLRLQRTRRAHNHLGRHAEKHGSEISRRTEPLGRNGFLLPLFPILLISPPCLYGSCSLWVIRRVKNEQVIG